MLYSDGIYVTEVSGRSSEMANGSDMSFKNSSKVDGDLLPKPQMVLDTVRYLALKFNAS